MSALFCIFQYMLIHNIYLIGMMGSGKSTLGKKIANRHNVVFIDLDAQVEQKEGISIHEMFDQHGENYFRDKEAEALRTIKEQDSPFVCATGGGTPCFKDSLTYMLKNGTVVWVDPPLKMIVSRLENAKDERPLLVGLDREGIAQKLEQLMEERRSWYEQADLRFDPAKDGLDTFIQELYLYQRSRNT